MSDELRPSTTMISPRDVKGVIDHRCEHAGCIAWGSWGYPRIKTDAVVFAGEDLHRDIELTIPHLNPSRSNAL